MDPPYAPPTLLEWPLQGSSGWRDGRRARLAEVKAEIAQFQSRIDILELERKQLEVVLESFTFSVATIPDDVVVQIFLQCLPGDGRVQPSRHTAPLLLASISKQWRAIALSTSRLWSSIDLTFRSGSPLGDSGMFRITSSYTLAGGFEDVDSPYLGASALVETWFNRANRHPLSITLRCMDRATLPLSILPAIAKFAGQWQRLEVLLRGGIPPILPQIRGIFPMLKEVVIELPFSSSMSSSMVPAIFLPVEAPELHRIRLLGGCRFHHLGTAPSPLVSLEINRISLDNLSSIFRAFPSLRRFSAHIDLPVAVSHIPQTFNDSLHELEVLGYGTHALQFLTLPCLQRLQCSVREHVLPILVSFLSRSSCNLQHLSLKETRADLALEVLHAIPSLFTLDFEGERTHDLYEHLQSRALVPQLTHLSISEYDDEYRQAPVVAMLLSRRVAPAQLVSFELTLGTTDHDAVDTELPTHALPLQLKHLISQGLLIRVRRSRSFRSVE